VRNHKEEMDERRAGRLGEALREEVSELIQFELTDPRLTNVHVVDVQVAPDGRSAHVQVSIPTEEAEAGMEALRGAAGFLRREVASRLDMNRIPDLRFEKILDLGPPARANKLLRKVRKGRPRE
jgi:ribosome-binding factor A